ncbi:hypothetical protein O1L60_26840 [Streptomyces diastatochromogenes]|nr:hypothetical protein [Streptomyces diastatochromogenes]
MPVPGAALGLADVLLQGVAHDGAVGQPVRQSGADQRVGVEDVQLAAEPAVVVHGGLLAWIGRVTTARSPGALAPRLRHWNNGQRAGTLSGVVVLIAARFMRGP